VAILAGDFLLARASVSLAALRDTEVIELLSQVIEHLVSGEILQARPCSPPCLWTPACADILPVTCPPTATCRAEQVKPQ
jgi:hypothetical protein